MRVILPALCCVLLFVAADAMAKRDRTAHVDSIRDSSGAMLYRIRCTDITVRLRSGAWTPSDSIMFFAEYLKVQQASTVLRSRVDSLHTAMTMLTDSAGAYIAQGRYTRATLDTAVARLQTNLEQTTNTHNYSLRRLEDYQSVLNAAHPILRRVSSR